MNDPGSMHILLADDDKDDCLLFKDALNEQALGTSLITVHDGEQLMDYLEKVSPNLPNALFLDLNMPRKNGFECLMEIKKHFVFKIIPVIILSTSYDERIANNLYLLGAHSYLCKPADFKELKILIYKVLILVKENMPQVAKNNFLITMPKSTM